MASYTKRGDSWRVQVAKNGQRLTATFKRKQEAQAWAALKEQEITDRKIGRLPDKTFADLLEKYGKEVSPTKKGELWELKRIRVLSGYRIASVRLSDLDSMHVSEWKAERLKDVSSASVLRDWTLMSHACEIARKEWKWLNSNPFKDVRRPQDGKPREKVFTEEEIDRLCVAFGIPKTGTIVPNTITQRVGYAFLFALETAMRAGEIVAIRKEHVFSNHVFIPDSKTNQSRKVPLSERAVQILSLFADREQVFDLNSQQLDILFRKAKKAALVDGRFHDARRTALTRLAKVYQNPLDLARVSGHKNLSILLKHYYQPDIDELAEKLRCNKTHNAYALMVARNATR